MPNPTVWDSMYRSEFNRALATEYPPEVMNVLQAVSNISTTKRKERQAWMMPLSNLVELTEQRTERVYTLPSYLEYEVKMKKYGGGFIMSKDDMEDEQMGMWREKPAELVRRARQTMVKQLITTAVAAETTLNFESTSGQYHAANTHTIGTGDNLLASTGAGSGEPHMISLYLGSSVKPLIWYDRQAPTLGTNAGTADADEKMQTRWWADMRGAPCFGFWWDFIMDAVTGYPTVAEFQTILGNHIAQFRSFTDPNGDYIHEQTDFNATNWLLLIRPEVEAVARAVQQNPIISNSTNEWVGRFKYLVTNSLPNT